jgi:hypothetical protein
MKHTMTVLVVIAASGLHALSEGFAYLDFNGPTRLVFQADAVPTNGICRLTPAAQGKVGGVWYGEQMDISEGFQSTFQFQITDRAVYGADGLAFVLQVNRTPSLGKPGWQMGFGGISNSVIVKFDNYHWKDKVYQRYDEIAVSTCGESGECDPDTNAVASVTRDGLFSDGKIHTARVEYADGQMSVFLDDFRQPLLRTPLRLPPAFNLSGGTAWVGFTAATGGDFQNHDVLSWTFVGGHPANEQMTRATRVNGAPEVPAQRLLQLVPQDSQASSAQPAPIATHQRGPILLAFPQTGVESWRIEASTNMVDWAAITNISLYFSDPESSNFNHRFYRILQQ